MSYKIEQKIGNNTYIYEVISFWDPEKKQPRQKRKYLGKKEPVTGKIVTPNKSLYPKYIKDFGHLYFMEQISERLGLSKIIKSVFPDIYNEILSLCFFWVLENKPLYIYSKWLENTFYPSAKIMNVNQIKDLLARIGDSKLLIKKFFEKWVKYSQENSALITNITLNSENYKSLDYFELDKYPENFKKEIKKICFVFGNTTGLPLYFKIFKNKKLEFSTIDFSSILVNLNTDNILSVSGNIKDKLEDYKLIEYKDFSEISIFDSEKSQFIITNFPKPQHDDLYFFNNIKYNLEKSFDFINSSIESTFGRYTTVSENTGCIFLSFLIHIIFLHINKKMKDYEMNKIYNYQEIIMELKKIKSIEMSNGKRYFSEINKRQEYILNKFGINTCFR